MSRIRGRRGVCKSGQKERVGGEERGGMDRGLNKK
jgi:hypothetical protein